MTKKATVHVATGVITVDTSGVATLGVNAANETYAAYDYREVAAKAAAELERRGWATGEYAITEEANPDFTYPEGDADYDSITWDEQFIHISTDTCRVCAVGAVAAAIYNDPTEVVSDDPAFNAVLGEIADRIKPGWREEKHVESWPEWQGQLRYGVYNNDYPTQTATFLRLNPGPVITNWNDDEASGADEVIGKFRAIAAGEL